MKYHLPDRIVRELCSFAQKYAVAKIVLFGSRARGTNTERSDVDIAVYGGDFDGFYWDIKENIHSLLMFDVVQADASISDEFYKIGFISDSEVWLLMLKKRNTSVHIYNEDEADEMILLIRDSFIPTFTTLKDTLVKKLNEAESSWM